MAKSRWARALVGVLAVGMLSIGAARADGTCKDDESIEKRVAELEAIIKQTPTPPVHIKACNDGSVDLRSAAVGFKCRTFKGSIFERVARNNFGEAWKGPDGLIWSDFVGTYSQYDAITTCQDLGGALPSRADFERGEANGFREVLPNMQYQFFWSSSVSPDYLDLADVFNGDDGITFPGGNRDAVFSVRCVVR